MNPNVISNRETILHIVHIFYNYVYTCNLLHKQKKKKKKTFYFLFKNLETETASWAESGQLQF